MDTSKSSLLVTLCIFLSLLLLPLVLGRILWDTDIPYNGSVIRKITHLVSLYGFLAAQPLGWLNAIIGSKIVSRRPKIGSRIIAIIGIAMGILGILTGLIWSAILVLAPY
jgi:hypothetical protein